MHTFTPHSRYKANKINWITWLCFKNCCNRLKFIDRIWTCFPARYVQRYCLYSLSNEIISTLYERPNHLDEPPILYWQCRIRTYISRNFDIQLTIDTRRRLFSLTQPPHEPLYGFSAITPTIGFEPITFTVCWTTIVLCRNIFHILYKYYNKNFLKNQIILKSFLAPSTFYSENSTYAVATPRRHFEVLLYVGSFPTPNLADNFSLRFFMSTP